MDEKEALFAFFVFVFHLRKKEKKEEKEKEKKRKWVTWRLFCWSNHKHLCTNLPQELKLVDTGTFSSFILFFFFFFFFSLENQKKPNQIIPNQTKNKPKPKPKQKQKQKNRAKEWNLSQPLWTGRMIIKSKGKDCVIHLQNDDGE